jgi:hypothetical protein
MWGSLSDERTGLPFQVKVKVTLRLTVSQSVSLGVEPRPDIYYSSTVTVLFLWGALSDQRTGLSFIYAVGPSQHSLSRVQYCLRFETSLFVASYDSQGHGGRIRTRLHTGGVSKSKSKLLYDWRFTANQFVLASSPLRLMTRFFFSKYQSLLYSPGTDRTENISSNIACFSLTGKQRVHRAVP